MGSKTTSRNRSPNAGDLREDRLANDRELAGVQIRPVNVTQTFGLRGLRRDCSVSPLLADVTVQKIPDAGEFVA